MFQLEQSNTATVIVKGAISDAQGKRKPFDFTLICDRSDVDELQAFVDDKTKNVKQFMKEKATDWAGVKDKSGADVPFSADALDQLLSVPGIPHLVFSAYVQEVQAIAKN